MPAAITARRSMSSTGRTHSVRSGRWQNIWRHLRPKLDHKPRWIAATVMAQIMGGNSRPDRKPPKVISPSDPSSAWTAKANKRMAAPVSSPVPKSRRGPSRPPKVPPPWGYFSVRAGHLRRAPVWGDVHRPRSIATSLVLGLIGCFGAGLYWLMQPRIFQIRVSLHIKPPPKTVVTYAGSPSHGSRYGCRARPRWWRSKALRADPRRALVAESNSWRRIPLESLQPALAERKGKVTTTSHCGPLFKGLGSKMCWRQTW
jgi:hypothetical protein